MNKQECKIKPKIININRIINNININNINFNININIEIILINNKY